MASASDNPNDSVREMEEDLSCYICYNLLQDPKELECPHIYCLSCLQDWVGKQATVECPECRYITIVPEGGLKNLKNNLRLKSMVEKYADRIEKQKGVPLCPDHEGERQHFYCFTCKKTVCRDCLVIKHPRQTHDLKELKDIARSKKDEIKVKMRSMLEQTNKFKESEKKLSEAEMKLQVAAEKANKDIEKHAQDIKAKVDVTCHAMKQIVETTRQHQINLLHQKQNHAGDNATRLQNVQAATQNVLDTAADHVYMTQHAALVERMDKLCVMEHEAPSWDFDSLHFNPAPILNDSHWFGNASLHGNRICGLKLVHEFGQFHFANGIAVTSDGLVAVVDYEAKKTEIFQSNGDIYESKFCLNSKKECTPYKVCVTNNDRFCVNCDNDLMIFSASGKYLRTVESCACGTVAASPDGTIIAGFPYRQTIALLKCNGENSKVMKTYKIDQNLITDIISNGTQIVYTTGDGGKVCAIDFKTGQTLWAIDMVWPAGICYEPKSNTLLIAGGSKYVGKHVIEQYCSATGRLISRLATGLYNPLSMTVTHDNKLLVADEKTVKVYEIQ